MLDHYDLFSRHVQNLTEHQGGELRGLCPLHDDHEPSWSGNRHTGLWRCFGCGAQGNTYQFAERVGESIPAKDRQDGRRKGGGNIPPDDTAIVQSSLGCTLEQYAEAKKLPTHFLRNLGLSNISYMGFPAVRIPYFDTGGAEVAVRFRLALGGENRFRWKSGAKPCLHGLWRLDRARKMGCVVLVEGESDCHTLWRHDFPALGIPGVSNWREARDANYLDNIATVYVVVEPDKGGETLRQKIATSRIRDRVRLVDLGKHKDPSGLYLDDPDHFLEHWQAALEVAVPWGEQVAAEASTLQQAARKLCKKLAHSPSILDRFSEDLARRGVVGENKAAKLLYLAITSRLLERPVSVAVKGPSAGGKSYLLQQVLGFFPDSACYVLSAMSERAMVYSEEPLEHRFLVVYEAVGLQSDFASYLVRSLLSEGRVRYETVEKTKDGLRPKLIEREGPTGLLVTTTLLHLHSENETRLLSIPVTDTAEQTKSVLLSLADEGGEAVDLTPWHALQTWLEGGEHRVTIPYAKALAEKIPPVAVRLRRDFGAVLNLIRAHALLHQASRKRDVEGCIIATLDDYAVVRELVADLIAEGVETTVSLSIRETVEAVALADGASEVTVLQVARKLNLDKATTSRRVRAAIDRGFLKNLEDRRRRPARLVLGDPLPDNQKVLPDPEVLGGCSDCTIAVQTEGIDTPPTPQDAEAFEEL